MTYVKLGDRPEMETAARLFHSCSRYASVEEAYIGGEALRAESYRMALRD